MQVRLYQFITSPFCAKVRKILEYKGVAFETVEVDYIERKELLLASGQIMVPALTMESGETVADSERIAERLEAAYPEPTLFPPGLRGVHRALARYIDSAVYDAVMRVAMPDVHEHWRRQGAESLALFRMIRERRFGAGFFERLAAERDTNLERMRQTLAPFEESLADNAFVLGRIGLADFALYGQLHFLALTDELKIPADLANLRAFFERVDRISASLEAA